MPTTKLILVYKMYLEISATPATAQVNPTAQAITDVELEIGGQKIDKHSGNWLEAWAELTQENQDLSEKQYTNVNF